MPFHDFRCPVGHVTEQFVGHDVDSIPCPKCVICTPECADSHIPGYDVIHVGLMAKKVFLKAPKGYVQGDVCYDSPIDGRPITTMKARAEDMKRNNCVPYDPEQKTDYKRRIDEGNAKLEKKMGQTVEAEIEKMPPRKRELLASELKHNNVDVERITPSQTSSLQR